jgi:hypothetical protein
MREGGAAMQRFEFGLMRERLVRGAFAYLARTDSKVAQKRLGVSGVNGRWAKHLKADGDGGSRSTNSALRQT